MKTQLKIFSVLICLCQLARVGYAADQNRHARFKVLVVMSYEESYSWCRQTKTGIDEILSPSHQVHYFYMDTKNDYENGPQKAQEAFKLFQALQPDGVIAADDNAQSMFVVPYLKDKVKTPVMFCGVNEAPEKYGYPASNVSGILERLHVAETIAFAQQLVPTIKTVGIIGKDSPTIRAIQAQVNGEYSTYSAKFVDFKTAGNRREILSMAKELKAGCDLLCIMTLRGITDTDGRPMDDKEIGPLVADAFGKTVATTDHVVIPYAAMCAVVKNGWEQGLTSARMLLKAMEGTPVDRIPIEVNSYGKRYINVTMMKKMGIRPKPILLQGAKLIRTQE
nr:ABC transporter substrate binding protein [uncultured Desulfobacter sp.]